MRDEASLRVHHVGLAALANLDLGDDVPDQLQVDFSDADAGVATRAGKRQRHVRFGLAAEIDRAVIDLVFHRLGELRLLGQVETAADHIHRQARYAKLFLAACIDLRKFGDGRNLAQQT